VDCGVVCTRSRRKSTAEIPCGAACATSGFPSVPPCRKQRVQHISIGAWDTYAEQLDPVHISWLRTAKRLKGEISVVNFDGSELPHTKLLTAAIAFSRALRKHTAGQQNIGVLLPASSGGVITTLAVMMNGRTVIQLNYTANRESLQYALSAAGITTVISSQQFLQKLEAKGFDLTPLTEQVRIVALEDIRKRISKPVLVLTAVLARLAPTPLLRALYFRRPAMHDTAAILFSSGSEGTPKGVELSHLNLIGNIKQENDVVLSSLPLFHAFGLTASTLMPLVEGLPFVCQPDPTDAVAVGKQVAKYKVTLMFGTSTFLGLYTRNPRVHPLMFRSLRMVVSGAEKLHEQVRTGFREKFGHPIYEGYGTTETTPVAGVNLPDVLSTRDWTVQTGTKPGTIGLPVPGSAFRIVDPTTLEELPLGAEGLILIAGPQLMKGYLNDPARTASVFVELDGVRWYKTGDKGRLDDDGFLTILDRYSRFAKIGGEMVSLAAVEAAVVDALPPSDMELTAVAVPNAGKGEQIVLLVSNTREDPRDIRKQLIEARISPLLLPSVVVVVDAIPRLGSGKTDFARAKQLALAHTATLEPVVS
jgi:acyl-[acyl-carrier-protein]-phospholipid O-acyltransferase/long-chain-fatty-acid--[acyl-carrier-protein] ligase